MRRAPRTALARLTEVTRGATLQLVQSVDAARLESVGCTDLPGLDTPLRTLGRIAWFQERWCLREPPPKARRALRPGMLRGADAIFGPRRCTDSAVARKRRLGHDEVLGYARQVLDATLRALHAADDDDASLYRFRLALTYEMREHETLAMIWHELGWPTPVSMARPPAITLVRESERFEASVSGIGALAGAGFVVDNEKWLEPVPVAPFDIGTDPVTQGEYLNFVQDGGYRDARWWHPVVFRQLSDAGRRMPRHWVSEDGRTRVRWFDQIVPLDPAAPVVQVSAWEAEAYCAWLGCALPTEAQWCTAARHGQQFRWGDRVWEWTATPLGPLPGFRADACTEFSLDVFGATRVVKGGSFVTPRDLVSPVYRNFLRPDLDAAFVGFRTARGI